MSSSVDSPMDTPGDDPGEIESRLREIPVPAPRREWRDGLRNHFVTNESPEAVSPRTEGVIETILRRSPAPGPPAVGFREELRARFIAGDLTKEQGGGAPEELPDLPVASVRPGPTPVRRTPRSTSRTRRARDRGRDTEQGGRKFPLTPVLVGLVSVAAAVLVVTLGPWSGATDPAWLRSDASALVGEVAAAEAYEDVQLGDLTLRMRPGTEARFEAPTDELALVHLDAGEVFVRTPSDYDGPPLVVRTPDLDMRLTGTVLGVALLPGGGTCVCVHRGEAEVTEHGAGDSSRIPGGERYVLWAGKEAYQAELPDSEPHVEDLVDFAHE